MCQPGIPEGRPDHQELAAQRRWLLLQLSAMVADSTVNSDAAAAAAEGGREGGGKQYCICSPTKHPGSFRCRLHRAGFRGKRQKPSH